MGFATGIPLQMFPFEVATYITIVTLEGAQWLSGRVLDSRPRGREFEPHWRHCVVVHEQDTFILALYCLSKLTRDI